jgi:hypothetical protein
VVVDGLRLFEEGVEAWTLTGSTLPVDALVLEIEFDCVEVDAEGVGALVETELVVADPAELGPPTNP